MYGIDAQEEEETIARGRDGGGGGERTVYGSWSEPPRDRRAAQDVVCSLKTSVQA